MESPFANNNSTFVLYLEPVRNQYYKTYQNIITVSTMPPGPLEQLVKPLSFEKLSSFQQASPFYQGMNCVHVLFMYCYGIQRTNHMHPSNTVIHSWRRKTYRRYSLICKTTII